MKKALPVLLSLALLVATTISSQVNAATIGIQETNDRITSEENAVHFYYESPERSEYQLSQEQLDAPTDVLVDAILDYPYLVDLFCSNSTTVDTYQLLRESFNGFAELEKRTDATSVMLSKFANVAMSTSEDNMMSASYLQTLLAVPSYFERLSASEVDMYNLISENSALTVDTSVEQYAENIPASESTYSSASMENALLVG